MYLFGCPNLCITMCCVFFSTYFTLYFCYNMNLYFGPAALHYIINNILYYLIYLLINPSIHPCFNQSIHQSINHNLRVFVRPDKPSLRIDEVPLDEPEYTDHLGPHNPGDLLQLLCHQQTSSPVNHIMVRMKYCMSTVIGCCHFFYFWLFKYWDGLIRTFSFWQTNWIKQWK